MQCTTPSNQYAYNCYGTFSRYPSNCYMTGNYPITISTDDFTATPVASYWLQMGYNRVLSLNDVPIATGSFLGWVKNATGSIMADPSCSPRAYKFGSFFSSSGPYFSSSECSFLMNVFISRSNTMSVLKMYAQEGVYSVTASVSHTYGSTPIVQTQTVLVIGNLTDLKILVNINKPY